MIYTDEDASVLKDFHKEHIESSDAKNKNLLTLLSTVFAIVIAFNDIKYTNKILFWFYVILISVFLISILSGIVLLYAKPILLMKQIEDRHYLISIREKINNNKIVFKTKLPIFFTIVGNVFDVTSFSSIILLAVFSIIKAVL